METYYKPEDLPKFEEIGKEGTGLELDLVSNPTGAFLPPAQAKAEERFRTFLNRKWGVVFNHLFTFANVPLGREASRSCACREKT
jgi:hypothetical protein